MPERALVLDCDGAQLVGVVHDPPDLHSVRSGVVVVVGGPQYRVGSQRSFVLLARTLAGNGVPCLRFDYRGMGDSAGPYAGFEHIDADVHAAIDRLLWEYPQLRRVCLWGLCDAASAILMYAWRDARVTDVVVVNPWVRSVAGQAHAILKRYYLRRLGSADFWRKLVSGRVHGLRSIYGFLGNWVTAHAGERAAAGGDSSFEQRMLVGLERFAGRLLLITSGDDLTAAEFLGLVETSARWRQALARLGAEHRHLAEATHTFSTARWRQQVEQWTLTWLQQPGAAS